MTTNGKAVPGFLSFWLLLLFFPAVMAFAEPFAYISNYGDNTVSVIDTATNTVVGVPIAVGTHPTGNAVHPAGTYVYVTNGGSHTISVIDTATNTVVDTVMVGAYPRNVAVHPAGTFVYVTNYDSNNV